jgi:hypothetical protein
MAPMRPVAIRARHLCSGGVKGRSRRRPTTAESRRINELGPGVCGGLPWTPVTVDRTGYVPDAAGALRFRCLNWRSGRAAIVVCFFTSSFAVEQVTDFSGSVTPSSSRETRDCGVLMPGLDGRADPNALVSALSATPFLGRSMRSLCRSE